MSYPIKTSDANWLNKCIELFEKRISISIIEDTNYNLNVNSDVIKSFRRFTLSKKSLSFLLLFYLLAVVCLVLFYYSFSLQSTKTLGIILSIIFFALCSAIPTYYLLKNKAPRIRKTEQGIDIIFH